MTDRELVPGCTRVRTKCAEKTSVDLWGQSRDPRELPGVTGPARGWAGVLHPLKKKPLSEKQQGKRPQVQTQVPQVKARPLPKKNQATPPQVEIPTKKKGGSQCCYICREKGHFASSCTSGTLIQSYHN